MNDNTLNICCCTDDNYAQYCAVMLCSLFENNRGNNIIVHILISTLSESNTKGLKNLGFRYGANILFHKVDSAKLSGCQYRIKRPLSEAAYYRVLLASILKDVDKILYLDCDIIVKGNIRELFEIEMDNYALAAVQEPVEIEEVHRLQLSIPYGESYFNSGVLLINLNYWRENN